MRRKLPRIWRLVFHVGTALSLVLWSVTVSLWLRDRSDLAEDGRARLGRVSFGIASANGEVGLSCNTDYPNTPRAQWRSELRGRWDLLQYCDHRAWGFGFYYGMGTSPGKQASMIRVIVVPHWALAMAFATLPAIWLTRRIRHALKGPNTRCGASAAPQETVAPPPPAR
jgi:hypothetical protein